MMHWLFLFLKGDLQKREVGRGMLGQGKSKMWDSAVCAADPRSMSSAGLEIGPRDPAEQVGRRYVDGSSCSIAVKDHKRFAKHPIMIT